MFKKVLLSCLILLLALVSFVYIKQTPAKEKKPYQPNWESLKKYETPEWFCDAKLGIFIHWGPYSVPAFGSEWYPRFMYQDSVIWNGEGEVIRAEPSWVYNHHLETYGHPGEFGYKDFIPMFKAEKFDADEWMDIFEKAGAKYVVPVAEHHDAFAMYNSSITRWNAVNMGPRRDVLKELSEAGKQRGLKIGASSHFAFNWDYFHKKAGFDTADPQFADLYGRQHEPYIPADQEFIDLWWRRTKEIIDNYQPDVLWFDFVLDREEYVPYHPKLAAYYYNKGLEWDKEVVLQNKNFNNFESYPPGTNVLDLERGKLADIGKYPWQTDTSIGKNSWCYVKDWNSKSPNTIVDDLIDVVSKNGNLLLNVGPKADGSIPEDQKEVLFALGDWLATNGKAIYGTRPWKVFGEGPTKVATGHHSEQQNKTLTSKDFRFTSKGNNLYAMSLDWSQDGTYFIKSLGKNSGLLATEKINEITLLSAPGAVQWEQQDDGLFIQIDPEKQGNYACAFEIQLD
ncbi:alpha-L-fucosidase [Fulvivirgaceae bacterium BMA12]|uniref:alpha-L-fucosidase n=1 Tax=Agaribacillus aureus TaxID=3051825 RepID=A0ABT8L236_9BACT|nr:alpha-L-fucosidase [Fulvivirgaceae bacterium BMA12]